MLGDGRMAKIIYIPKPPEPSPGEIDRIIIALNIALVVGTIKVARRIIKYLTSTTKDK